ncbi:hypothetical protein DVH24_041250, partial [Malus domestica]
CLEEVACSVVSSQEQFANILTKDLSAHTFELIATISCLALPTMSLRGDDRDNVELIGITYILVAEGRALLDGLEAALAPDFLCLENISFHHIYRETNLVADALASVTQSSSDNLST